VRKFHPSDDREELWSAAYETYYDCLFEELIADSLITRWGSVDEATKVLVMITASGSAVSGWALWNQTGYRLLWLGISGVAAFLSIAHTALGIPGRIKAHSEDKRRFAGLRTEMETFRYSMRVHRDGFNVEQFMDEFREYRRRYSEYVQLLSNDIARTQGLELKTQAEVNARLGDEILPTSPEGEPS
jgi:hypothetical protein